MSREEWDQLLIDAIAWGMFYTMSEPDFRDPARPWNRMATQAKKIKKGLVALDTVH